MEVPQIVGILGTAKDRCGLVSFVTTEGNGQLHLRTQEANGVIHKPYTREEFTEALGVAGGGHHIDPPIPLRDTSIRGGWFGSELLRASHAWKVPLPAAVRLPRRQFQTGVFWMEDLDPLSRTLNEWTNAAAAAILFTRHRPDQRFPARFPRLFPELPAVYAVLYMTAPNAEHQWVVVQRYIRRMSPEGKPLTEKDARNRIQDIIGALKRIYQPGR